MPISNSMLWLFCMSLLLIALLYSSVGQAGASGFVALMALFGFAPDAIKPTALVLNVLVSALVALRFSRSGHFSWELLRPFLLASMPAALLGGYLTLPVSTFQGLLGGLLLLAGTPLLTRNFTSQEARIPPRGMALFAGGIIGLLSGLTGMGGGVLLAPLLVLCRWARTHSAAAASAVFILLNSLMALLGHLSLALTLPEQLPWFALAAALGGLAGAKLGCAYLSPGTIQRILGGMLALAGIKLLIQA